MNEKKFQIIAQVIMNNQIILNLVIPTKFEILTKFFMSGFLVGCIGNPFWDLIFKNQIRYLDGYLVDEFELDDYGCPYMDIYTKKNTRI
jgi:hypothetical protein